MLFTIFKSLFVPEIFQFFIILWKSARWWHHKLNQILISYDEKILYCELFLIVQNSFEFVFSCLCGSLLLLLVMISIVGNISLKYLIIIYFYLFIIIFSTDFVSVAGAPGVYMVWGARCSQSLYPFLCPRAPTCYCNAVVKVLLWSNFYLLIF